MDHALKGVLKGLNHLLNTLQLRIEHHFCLVFVATAFRTPRFSLGSFWFGFPGLLLGLAGGFFFCGAHGLFDADRIGASLLDTDQGQGEKG